MAQTAARVLQNGLPYQIVGSLKRTVTDLTITAYTASGEPFTPADVGLNAIYNADAKIQSVSGAGGTAVEAAVVGTAAAPLLKLNLATGADGAAGATNTVARVFAYGY
jgi:hypothetical protein